MNRIRLFLLRRRVNKYLRSVVYNLSEEINKDQLQSRGISTINPDSYMNNSSLKDAFPNKSPINRHDLSDFNKIVMADDLLKKYASRPNPKFFIDPLSSLKSSEDDQDTI